MKRRANGEGSIYKRKDGLWAATISLERGRRKSFYGKTRQAVAEKLASAFRRRQDGLRVLSDRQSMAGYLKGWLEAVGPSLRPQTFRRYEQYVRIHANPIIGAVPLAQLSPQHLERLYANRLESGLSPTSVAHLHAVLHRALGQAARQSILGRNVADVVTKPRIRRHEISVLTPEQVRALVDAAHEDRLKALYVLAISTGMRQGELLALKWRDIDLDGAALQVRTTLQRTKEGFDFSEPKTARSRRQVALTRAAVEALRLHRARQIRGAVALPFLAGR